MSEFKFDKMKNLDIPDEWAENTIKKANKMNKSEFIFDTRYVRIAAYMSMLVIVLIGVFTFSLPQSNVDIKCATEKTELTSLNNNNNSVVMSQQSTDGELIVESLSQSENETVNEIDNDTDTDNNGLEPNESVNNEDGSSNSNSFPSSGGKPNNKPPQYEETQSETEYWEWLYSYHFRNIFMLEDLAEDRKVYCKIYSEDEGRFLGDPDLFSDEHLTEYEFINDTYCEYRYYPIHLGVLTKNGVYTSYFYNSSGEIFYTNSFFFTRFNED